MKGNSTKAVLLNKIDPKRVARLAEEYFQGVKKSRTDSKEVFTGKRCVICSGRIIEFFSFRYNDPLHRSVIIGPGSRQQYDRLSDGYRCEDCGVAYYCLPKDEVYDKIKKKFSTAK